tara:strand:+ start:343 stop:573 length:231 start_codon:yes stop_codon:yes gene_type:complete
VAVEVFMAQLVQELQVQQDLVVEGLVDNPLLEVVQIQEDLMVQLEQQTLVVAVVEELELIHQMVVAEQVVVLEVLV